MLLLLMHLNVVVFLIIDIQVNEEGVEDIEIDDVLKSSVSCRLQVMSMSTCGIKTQGPNKRHL